MNRVHITVLVVIVIVSAFVIEAYFGSTRYRLKDTSYDVPHQYEFLRNFRVPWLEGIKGIPPEPEESIWLMFPADQLAEGIPGYSRLFHGYAGDYGAELVANVVGGKEAGEFPSDYARLWGAVRELEKSGVARQPDRITGWDRVESLGGNKGTPAEGHSNFYLTPKAGLPLPRNWLPPSCLASPDVTGRETYYCNFTIYKDGLTFRFSLRQENLRVSSQIPAYVLSRLEKWRL